MRLRTTALSLVVVIGACGDDDKPTDTTADGEVSETSPDTEVGEVGEPDGETSPDAEETNIPDGETQETGEPGETTNPGDVTGEPLEGTTLDGIRVHWERSLALCNAWSEGASIDEELAHQVRITMSGQGRDDLTFDDLADATVLGLTVRKGPFAADKVMPSATSRVARYEVIRGEGYDALGAEIEHDLGAGGVLVESYSVARASDNDDSVEIGEGSEVLFLWAPAPGGTYHLLQPCELPADYTTAVAVLPASNETSSATFIRYYGTLDSEFSAGSYPVRLLASQVVLSEEPWRVFEATGEWAQTYAAQHHNWGEATRIDFTRDLGFYQTVVKALRDGEPVTPGMVKTIQFEGVGGGDDGSVAITRLDGAGVESEVAMTTARQWRRVDSAYLGRQLEGCAGRAIAAIGYGDHTAQIVTCTDAAGPKGLRLVAVVPVRWSAAPEEVGNVHDDITATATGWSLSIGASTVHIEPADNNAYLMDVLDAGGESVGNSFSEPYQLAPERGGFDAPVDSQGGGVVVHIDRQWVGQAAGRSSLYAVPSVTLAWADHTYVVDGWDQIDYVNTHHNWNDTLEATASDGNVVHWQVVFDFDVGLVQTVWVTDAGGAEVLGRTVVTPIEVE